MQRSQNTRYDLVNTTAITSNFMHFRNPWIVAWWSLAFPGFGHFLVNSFIWGFILMSFEYLINTLTNLNTSIFYSMLGRFEEAKQVLNLRWFFLYIVVYIFAVWDSYRRAVDLNKVYQLAYSQFKSINPLHLSAMDINLLEKKSPLIAMIWSFLMPSLGWIYLQRIWSFLFHLVWWMVILYNSRLLEGIFYTMIGEFDQATHLLEPQWVLYLPSIYGFVLYSTYSFAVENNRLFELSQSRFLQNRYQLGSLDRMFIGKEN